MIYPLEECKQIIITEIKKQISENINNIKLEIPPENMGDFAFPCFTLASILKKSPKDIANDLATKIQKNKWITKIESKGGYVNFYINNNLLISKTLKLIFEMTNKYGHLQKKEKKI